jgi:hypothetical protein
LKFRVSAKAAVGENPNATRLELTSPAPLTRRNSLRLISIHIPPVNVGTSHALDPLGLSKPTRKLVDEKSVVSTLQGHSGVALASLQQERRAIFQLQAVTYCAALLR